MPSRKPTIRHAPIVLEFAGRLRSFRTSQQMTQRELADKAHITLTYVSKLEAGGAAPGIDLLERLAKALKVQLNALLPTALPSEPVESRRQRARERFEAVLAKAGSETLNMLDAFLATVVESPVALR